LGKIVELKPTPPEREPPRRAPRSYLFVFYTVLMLLGLLLIVGASWFTYRRLDDEAVFRVLIPGVVGGLVCIIIATLLIAEIRKNRDRR
jgi:hypothetical protein